MFDREFAEIVRIVASMTDEEKKVLRTLLIDKMRKVEGKPRIHVPTDLPANVTELMSKIDNWVESISISEALVRLGFLLSGLDHIDLSNQIDIPFAPPR
jgi:hypothetical protein